MLKGLFDSHSSLSLNTIHSCWSERAGNSCVEVPSIIEAAGHSAHNPFASPAVVRLQQAEGGGFCLKQKKRLSTGTTLFADIFSGKTLIQYGKDRNIFRQGQPADSLFYLRKGKIKLTVTFRQGKEAIVAVLGSGEFFGESCLAGQPLKMATAVAMTDCTLDRIEKSLMANMLPERHDVSQLFVRHLLSRNIRYEADLVDQLFNSSDKRLARILLLLAHFGKESRSELVLPRVSQDELAQMAGTTRSRISHFMNKFRNLGFLITTSTN